MRITAQETGGNQAITVQGCRSKAQGVESRSCSSPGLGPCPAHVVFLSAGVGCDEQTRRQEQHAQHSHSLTPCKKDVEFSTALRGFSRRRVRHAHFATLPIPLPTQLACRGSVLTHSHSNFEKIFCLRGLYSRRAVTRESSRVANNGRPWQEKPEVRTNKIYRVGLHRCEQKQADERSRAFLRYVNIRPFLTSSRP